MIETNNSLGIVGQLSRLGLHERRGRRRHLGRLKPRLAVVVELIGQLYTSLLLLLLLLLQLLLCCLYELIIGSSGGERVSMDWWKDAAVDRRHELGRYGTFWFKKIFLKRLFKSCHVKLVK